MTKQPEPEPLAPGWEERSQATLTKLANGPDVTQEAQAVLDQLPSRQGRISVAKLAQKYRDRIERLEAEVKYEENQIAAHSKTLQQKLSELRVWNEALAETNQE